MYIEIKTLNAVFYLKTMHISLISIHGVLKFDIKSEDADLNEIISEQEIKYIDKKKCIH